MSPLTIHLAELGEKEKPLGTKGQGEKKNLESKWRFQSKGGVTSRKSQESKLNETKRKQVMGVGEWGLHAEEQSKGPESKKLGGRGGRGEKKKDKTTEIPTMKTGTTKKKKREKH